MSATLLFDENAHDIDKCSHLEDSSYQSPAIAGQ
jgi:hypothetical protein